MNRYKVSSVTSSSVQSTDPQNSSNEADLEVLSRSGTSSTSNSNISECLTDEIISFARLSVRPEGEIPLVHAMMNSGRQVSQLTHLLSGESVRSSTSAFRNLTINSFPSIPEPTAFGSLSQNVPLHEAMIHQDTELPPPYSPFSTTSAIPLKRSASQSDSMIVGTPPFALRQRPTLHAQSNSVNVRNHRQSNGHAHIRSENASSQVRQLPLTLQRYLDDQNSPQTQHSPLNVLDLTRQENAHKRNRATSDLSAPFNPTAKRAKHST